MAQVNLKTVKDRVLNLLQTKPHLRDDDGRLIATIWWQDLIRQGIQPSSISAHNFMELFIAGSVTHPESIRRERANAQKQFEDLRGELYEKRHAKQGDVRKDLGYEG